MAIGATTGKAASNASATTTLAFSATAITAGQDIVVGVALADTTQTVTGIADTAGNVFTLRSAVNGSGVRTEVWEAQNIWPHDADIITITFSGATLAAAVFEEYSGIAAQATPVYPANAVPVMTGLTTPSGTASASSSYATTPAWHAFVGGADAGWIDNALGFPAWLQYQFPSGQTVTAYFIVPWSADSFPARSPIAWILKGSNDGSSWTDLDTRSFSSWTLNTPVYFPIASPGSYAYYRLHITANGGNAYNGLKQLGLLAGTITYTTLSAQNTVTRSGSDRFPRAYNAIQEQVNWTATAFGFACNSGDTFTTINGTIRQSVVPALTSVGVALVDTVGTVAAASLLTTVRLSASRNWAAASTELRSGGVAAAPSVIIPAANMPALAADKDMRFIRVNMPFLTVNPTVGAGPHAHGWAY